MTKSEANLIQIGNCSVRLDFNGNRERQEKLMPLCVEVLKHFDFLKERIDCFFAVSEDDYLTQRNGRHFRGFQIYYLGRLQLPHYLFDRFFHPYDGHDPIPTFDEQLAFDHLIYIRNATSIDTTGFVLTLAHELEHVRQHWSAATISTANNLLYTNALVMRCSRHCTVVDVPSERDANIVSKRIGEIVCGAGAVKAFAEAQVEHFQGLAKSGDSVDESERVRWVFFRDVPSTTEYDWLAATKSIIASCRQEIISKDLGRRYGLDFAKDEWWVQAQEAPEE
jgi:hypothetical protein